MLKSHVKGAEKVNSNKRSSIRSSHLAWYFVIHMIWLLAMQSVIEGPTRSARLAGKRLERKWRKTEDDISPNILEKKTKHENKSVLASRLLILSRKETSLLHLSAFQDICYILSYTPASRI